MKILAFTDHHGSRTVLKKVAEKAKKVDLIICTGDFTLFSNNIEEVLLNINKMNKPVLLFHGNHEDEEEVEMICEELPNITFFHKKVKKFGNYIIAGYGGGGFALVDEDKEKFFKKVLKKYKKEKVIILTHGPPHNTKLDELLDGHHCGCMTTRKIIEKHPNIVLALSGHIHETFGKEAKIGKTRIMNTGPYGKIIKL